MLLYGDQCYSFHLTHGNGLASQQHMIITTAVCNNEALGSLRPLFKLKEIEGKKTLNPINTLKSH